MARELTEQEKQQIMEMEPDFKLYGVMNLEKSGADDKDDEKRLVFGEISNPAEDEQGESLIQKSLDFSYFDDKGVIKFEHYPKNSPSNIIGFPHERLTSDNNTVIKGALLKGHRMADETWSLIRAIEDHNKQFPDKQKTLGWSVEGNYASKKRRGKFVKSAKIYNVVITANPVLKSTYLKMVEENNAPVLKSLSATPANTDMAAKTGGDVIVDDTIDGKIKDKTGTKDKKKKKKKSSKQNKEKVVMKSFKTHEEAVAHFVDQGLDEEKAKEMVKSLEIEEAPDADAPDNSEELSVISKSINQIKDLVKSLKPDSDEDLNDPEDVIDEEIDDDDVVKSLGDDEVDVTEFLEGINQQNQAILKSIRTQGKVYDVLEKSIAGFCDIVEQLGKEVQEIEKSLSVEGHPIGEAVQALMKSRQGFTTQDLQKYNILKSNSQEQSGRTVKYSELHARLEKSVEKNLITSHEQSRAENAFRLRDYDTMNEVLSKCEE